MENIVFNNMYDKKILNLASKKDCTIILPEAEFCEDIITAGLYCAKNKIAKIVVLFISKDKSEKYKTYENDYFRIVNIYDSELKPMLANALFIKRQEKGMTNKEANQLINQPSYFATMMVELGLVDGMVIGSYYSTKEGLSPALKIIKGKNKDSIISSCFIMISNNVEIGNNGILLLADCGLNINPSAKELVNICLDTVKSSRDLTFNKNPKVAMLCYSTKGSANGEVADKMIEATNLIKSKNIDFIIDGEMQFDAAVNKMVANKKAPDSEIKGDANILIFPDLQSGNIAYKIMQRFAGFEVVGPVCQGFRKPINDVSRGATIKEIIRAIAITVLQCD